MFVKSQYLITVIWLTVVLLMRSLADPIISNVMSPELKNCTFLADQAKETNVLMSWCAVPRLNPSITENVRFHLINFVCMELYDVSSQLCDPKYIDKVSSIENLKKSFPLPSAEEFCSKLTFYEKGAKSAEESAKVAISKLRIPNICKSFCVAEEDLHPLCEAIYLGNKLLIQLNSAEQQKEELQLKPSDMDVTVSLHNSNAKAENENKKPSLKLPDVTPKEQKKSDPEDVNPGTPVGGNNHIGNKKTDPETISGDVSHISNSKKENPEARHFQEAQVIGPAVGNEHRLDDVLVPDKTNLDITSSSQPPVPTVVLASGTDPLYKVPSDDHEDINNSDTLPKELGELTNDGVLSEDDVEENVPKGNIPDESGPHPIPQEETYGEPEEITQNLPNNKVYQDRFVDAQDSHFFAYFLTMVVICIVGYLVFHNKQKIIALALEGRRMQGSRRRPNTSSYKKLDSNLEEAVTSTCSSSSVTHVIF